MHQLAKFEFGSNLSVWLLLLHSESAIGRT